MFKVTRTKDNKEYTVYSVQMMVGQGPLGQPAPIVLFLIYNEDTARWELIESGEFVPEGVEVPDKAPSKGKIELVKK